MDQTDFQPTVTLGNAELERHFSRWRAFMSDSGATDKPTAERTIDALHRSWGMPEPGIIWVQSVYQLVTLPSLLIGILHSDLWTVACGQLEAYLAADEAEWSHHWDAVWHELWINSGEPLLRGMKVTSRIGELFADLEEPLIAQLKDQMGSAIKSGKLKLFESKLKKEEIYRRYWPRYHAHDFAKARWVQLKDDVYSVIQFEQMERSAQNAELHTVRSAELDLVQSAELDLVQSAELDLVQSAELDWTQLNIHDAELKLLARDIERTMWMLPRRMGAEPDTQAIYTIWLPCMLEWLASASLLSSRMWPHRHSSQQQEIQLWLDLCESVSAIRCLDGLTIALEKPTAFRLDDEGRLHDESGPALSYSDGFALYAWKGVIANRDIVERPETITCEYIERADNSEVRRVMIERYGEARYLQDSGAILVHEDDFGSLYRKELPNDEALVMVKVVNSTPEPDGTYKDYFLRVPPEIETAKQAVAWTFGFDNVDDYDPSVQT